MVIAQIVEGEKLELTLPALVDTRFSFKPIPAAVSRGYYG
jgi:hypothetical protein